MKRKCVNHMRVVYKNPPLMKSKGVNVVEKNPFRYMKRKGVIVVLMPVLVNIFMILFGVLSILASFVENYETLKFHSSLLGRSRIQDYILILVP